MLEVDTVDTTDSISRLGLVEKLGDLSFVLSSGMVIGFVAYMRVWKLLGSYENLSMVTVAGSTEVCRCFDRSQRRKRWRKCGLRGPECSP